jgi:hypothetical protein
VVVPALQELGLTDERTGVGSPTLKLAALLVPKVVARVRLCAPVLAFVAIE